MGRLETVTQTKLLGVDLTAYGDERGSIRADGNVEATRYRYDLQGRSRASCRPPAEKSCLLCFRFHNPNSHAKIRITISRGRHVASRANALFITRPQDKFRVN